MGAHRRPRTFKERSPVVCRDCGRSFTPAPISGRPPERCPDCRTARKRATDRAKSQRWKDANREKHVAYLREYHQARKDDPEYRRRRREAMTFYTYRITQAELDLMIQKQGGLCAICGGPPNGPGTRLHIDHCHETGQIRGLLCAKCNTAVGLLDNDPDRAELVAAYLRRSDMANSPSEKWENGVLKERAIETNRWKVLPDGTAVDAEEEAEAKAVSPAKAENKSVKAAAKK